jgi:hypothetical protein
MAFQKSQPIEAGHERLLSTSKRPLKLIDVSSLTRKAVVREMREKSGEILSTAFFRAQQSQG